MQHVPSLITDLALILGAAGLVSLIFKKLKQPIVLGYIIAGVLVGPNFPFFPSIVQITDIRIWADIGVIFLLFNLGLEFSFKKLLKVGGVSSITAFIEVGATMLLGYLLGLVLGWSNMDSVFMGAILCIASTTIISRALDEAGLKSQKFTGIVMGILVIEDLVAVVLMVLLSTMANPATAGLQVMISLVSLVFFLVLWFLAGIFFIPTFLKISVKLMTEETMLIIMLALCFGMVILSAYLGFSPALGAFIMGSILAETLYAERIEHLISPVKNLFGAVFFVSVGMLIDPAILMDYWEPIVACVLILIIAKPLFVAVGGLVSGQPLKIAVQSGMSLSQIGEFSFIIATLGISLNVISDFLYPLAVTVSVLTAFTTPYMIRFAGPVYRGLEKALPANITEKLARYSHRAQTVTKGSEWKRILRSLLIDIVVNSVILATIILIATQYIAPLIWGYKWGVVLTTVITLAVMSPFLWALSFRRSQRSAYARMWLQNAQSGPVIILQMIRVALAVFFVAILLSRLFSPFVALIAGLGITGMLLLFSKRIQAFYLKLELRFFNNLNEREKNTVMFAVWDTHMATFVLPSDSECVGQTLIELQLREKFGINIARISRMNNVIIAPERHERLYPNDKLSVIGNDEQLKAFKDFLEPRYSSFTQQNHDITLQQLVIGENSQLVNKNIRQSGIREKTRGLVVGVERDGERILNPESTFVFQAGDIVLVAGNPKRIKQIARETDSEI